MASGECNARRMKSVWLEKKFGAVTNPPRRYFVVQSLFCRSGLWLIPLRARFEWSVWLQSVVKNFLEVAEICSMYLGGAMTSGECNAHRMKYVWIVEKIWRGHKPIPAIFCDSEHFLGVMPRADTFESSFWVKCVTSERR